MSDEIGLAHIADVIAIEPTRTGGMVQVTVTTNSSVVVLDLPRTSALWVAHELAGAVLALDPPAA